MAQVMQRNTLSTEIQTYRRMKPDLLKAHRGEYALIHGDKLLGTFVARQDALRAGYEAVGPVPFLVQRIVEVERRKRIVSNVLKPV